MLLLLSYSPTDDTNHVCLSSESWQQITKMNNKNVTETKCRVEWLLKNSWVWKVRLGDSVKALKFDIALACLCERSVERAVSCPVSLLLLMFLGLLPLHYVGVCGHRFIFWSLLWKCLNEGIEKLRYLNGVCFETETCSHFPQLSPLLTVPMAQVSSTTKQLPRTRGPWLRQPETSAMFFFPERKTPSLSVKWALRELMMSLLSWISTATGSACLSSVSWSWPAPAEKVTRVSWA